MTKTFIGNMQAYIYLENYTKLEYLGPLILSGKKGLGKQKAAFSLASFLLKCPEDALIRNKDFILIDKGKESIKVEDILNLLDQSSVAALDVAKIYLICHAEKINIQAQNKLLKLLEDRSRANIVIFSVIRIRCLTQ